MLLLLLSACDDTSSACTEIGCTNVVILHVSKDNGDPVDPPTGEVTVGEHTISFDCLVENVEYTCDGADVTLYFTTGPGDVYVEAHNYQFVAAGTESPDWEEARPNGPDCEPVCFTAEIDVTMYATP